jgi:hypothetical protein
MVDAVNKALALTSPAQENPVISKNLEPYLGPFRSGTPAFVPDHPALIPQRLITAKKLLDTNTTENAVDLAALKSTPKLFNQHIGIVRGYPNVRADVAQNADDDALSEHFIDHATQNLLSLHDAVPPEIRNRGKKWYDGARAITDKWSKEYDIPDHAVAGVLAAMSPQKDWYQNVSLAHRVIHTMKGMGENFYHGFTFSPEMEERLKSIDSLNKPGYAGIHNMIRGKSLGDLDRANIPDDEKAIARAMWIRLHDQTYNSNEHRIVNPEGTFGDFVKTKSGKNAAAGWGSLTEIAKAIQALDNAHDPQKLSQLMGEKHKVRNFYNNILHPNSSKGDVTIDTHAVAAALMRPLSGNSVEVAHNFGSSPGKGISGAGGSSVSGVRGTYPLYAEAYRRAAKARGIHPREMQSITWEAVRGLFPDTFKTAKNSKDIDDVWSRYRKGEISQDEARNQVVKKAGGIRPPTWFAGGASQPHAANGGAIDQKGVSGPRVSREASRTSYGRTGDGTSSHVSPQSVGDNIDRALSLTSVYNAKHKRDAV